MLPGILVRNLATEDALDDVYVVYAGFAGVDGLCRGLRARLVLVNLMNEIATPSTPAASLPAM